MLCRATYSKQVLWLRYGTSLLVTITISVLTIFLMGWHQLPYKMTSTTLKPFVLFLEVFAYHFLVWYIIVLWYLVYMICHSYITKHYHKVSFMVIAIVIRRKCNPQLIFLCYYRNVSHNQTISWRNGEGKEQLSYGTVLNNRYSYIDIVWIASNVQVY